MANSYGSTRWYINRDLTGDVWYVNADPPFNSVWTIPRNGKILGPWKGNPSERPPQEYSSSSGERFDPREGAPTPTTGPPRGPSGGPSASAPPPQSAPPQASGPQPARPSAPPPFTGAPPPPYEFPPPPSYSMPRQAPTTAAAVPGRTLMQEVEDFFAGLENQETAMPAIVKFKEHLPKVRQAIRTGQLDVSRFKSAATKAYLKYHPDKAALNPGIDTNIFKVLQPIFGESEGLNLKGQGKPRRTRYVM